MWPRLAMREPWQMGARDDERVRAVVVLSSWAAGRDRDRNSMIRCGRMSGWRASMGGTRNE